MYRRLMRNVLTLLFGGATLMGAQTDLDSRSCESDECAAMTSALLQRRHEQAGKAVLTDEVREHAVELEDDASRHAAITTLLNSRGAARALRLLSVTHAQAAAALADNPGLLKISTQYAQEAAGSPDGDTGELPRPLMNLLQNIQERDLSSDTSLDESTRGKGGGDSGGGESLATPRPTGPISADCDSVWNNDADGDTCGSRIEWTDHVTREEAGNIVASNYPVECGACATPTAAPK